MLSENQRRYQRRYQRRCSVCDSWFSLLDQEAVNIHRHPEPQSGCYRDEWLQSGLNYADWIDKTIAGRAWLKQNYERHRPNVKEN